MLGVHYVFYLFICCSRINLIVYFKLFLSQSITYLFSNLFTMLDLHVITRLLFNLFTMLGSHAITCLFFQFVYHARFNMITFKCWISNFHQFHKRICSLLQSFRSVINSKSIAYIFSCL